MTKDKVLPLVPRLNGDYGYGACDQQNADWEVLERDYVSKKRIEVLVAEVKRTLTFFPDLVDLKEALAQLEEKP